MELKPYIGVRDTVIEGMAEAWQEELEVRGAGGRIQSEALGTALIVHLFRTYGEGGVTPRTITGGMSSTRLRRVVDYIESHLSEDIGLGSLASLAGFSVHHFSDVFKAETGFAPHRFLIERRIHRAKELLLTNDAPIAQIAAELARRWSLKRRLRRSPVPRATSIPGLFATIPQARENRGTA